MDVKDLTGLGSAFEKLIETVAAGIGRVSRSYFSRKDVNTGAYKIAAMAEALDSVAEKYGMAVAYTGDGVELRKEPTARQVAEVLPCGERINERIKYTEQRRQENIEAVTSSAAEDLLGKSASEEKVEEDWIRRFFEYAQDVSSEQMQQLWGRILSGEVRAPGTYSLKTLDFMRNLSKTDAHVVERVAKASLRIGGSYLLPWGGWAKDFPGIGFENLVQIIDLGVISANLLSFSINETKNFSVVQRTHVLACNAEQEKKLTLEVYKFTSLGVELLSLIEPEDDIIFLDLLGNHLKELGWIVCRGRIVEMAGNGQIKFNSERDF